MGWGNLMTRTQRSRLLSFSAILGIALLGGCSKTDNNAITDENLVLAGDPKTNRSIGDEANQFQVMGKSALREGIRQNLIVPLNSKQGQQLLAGHEDSALAAERATATTPITDASLILGFPIGLLGENQVFGGVVTTASDKDKENIGQLKLADLTPIHSRAVIGKGADGNYLFGIVGCFQQCTEGSEEPVLFAIPAEGVDTQKGLVLVDLAQLGKELNLIQMQDPQGTFTQLKTKSNKTVAFDYSYSTLVFDVETKMIHVGADESDPTAKETTFVVRWYLKLNSGFNPAFKVREAVPGVGFFMTERSETPKIQRWARPAEAGGVKYYLKNIPTEHRKAFSDSFDGWNEKFELVLGKKLLSYEFLETTDPRYNLIIAGDIRFNVLEWDLNNAAPYGGFGPSIANQFTGELMSANVLVQGPKIIEGYKKWFEIGEQAEHLRSLGLIAEADQLIRDLTVSMQAAEQKAKDTRFEMKIGNKVSFSIKSQQPGYEDPAFQRPDFDVIPKGFTFETYMYGYFIDLVEHELGHNMGLRHNFRGNLGAAAAPVKGGVSHSVMEYLGRGHRHLDSIGEYDAMALRYGYGGVLPERADMFCTDENVAAPNRPDNSAECSRDDANRDPFKFFESRLERQVALLTLPGSPEAPAWAVDDMDRELTGAITGLGLYAFSADETGGAWTNFFTGGDRPTAASGVKAYVLDKIKSRVCSASLDQAASLKGTPEAKAKTEQNIQALRTRVKRLLTPFRLYTDEELTCQ